MECREYAGFRILSRAFDNLSDFFVETGLARDRPLVFDAQHCPSVFGEDSGNCIVIVGSTCCPGNHIRECTCVTVSEGGFGKYLNDTNPKFLHRNESEMHYNTKAHDHGGPLCEKLGARS